MTIVTKIQHISVLIFTFELLREVVSIWYYFFHYR